MNSLTDGATSVLGGLKAMGSLGRNRKQAAYDLFRSITREVYEDDFVSMLDRAEKE